MSLLLNGNSARTGRQRYGDLACEARVFKRFPWLHKGPRAARMPYSPAAIFGYSISKPCHAKQPSKDVDCAACLEDLYVYMVYSCSSRPLCLRPQTGRSCFRFRPNLRKPGKMDVFSNSSTLEEPLIWSSSPNRGKCNLLAMFDSFVSLLPRRDP